VRTPKARPGGKFVWKGEAVKQRPRAFEGWEPPREHLLLQVHPKEVDGGGGPVGLANQEGGLAQRDGMAGGDKDRRRDGGQRKVSFGERTSPSMGIHLPSGLL